MAEWQVKEDIISYALVGNPNTGKSSLFNLITGLRQKVGNFAGVTVEKKEGFFKLPQGQMARVADFPGLYSLNPHSPDEEVITSVLTNPTRPDFPQVIIYVADAANLKRNLFLFTQLATLQIPMVLIITMMDVARAMGQEIDLKVLEEKLGVPVMEANGREFLPAGELPAFLETARAPIYPDLESGLTQQEFLQCLKKENDAANKLLAGDTIARYKWLDGTLANVINTNIRPKESFTEKLDKILLHPFWGYAAFLAVMLLVFQAVFFIAAFPMDWIDAGISNLSAFAQKNLAATWFSRLLAEGVIPGIGGVLVFIPQIAILFAFISILEDVGYMSRVIFISDRIMRKFGLSGKSVVPLFSGFACAVPAIMAARTIENRKERLLTILVTPFISCSARLPVFATLTAVAVPSATVWGVFNLQGLVLFSMYMLSIFFTVASAWVLNQFITSRGKTFFVLELPFYKPPRWGNVATEAYLKSRTFVLEAGKIIVPIAILLWFLAAFGPGNEIENAADNARRFALQNNLSGTDKDALIQSYKVEASYAGHIGHIIEPAIEPLGFDWKIGIALVASFAAREVFVGTMATIHSVGGDFESDDRLVKRMKESVNVDTHKPTYRLSVAMSLMIFYLLAMQCMSTFAIVRKETSSWGAAIGQLIGMTTLAWLCSYLTFQILEL